MQISVSRRSFVSSALAASGLSLLPGCCCFGAEPKTRVAVQLYSVRELIWEVGLPQVLLELKKMGYEGVELAGYYTKDRKPLTAKELKQILDGTGLVACGTHVGREALAPEKIAETIDFNLAYGNRYLMVPWMNSPRNCKDRKGFWKKLADDLSVAAETAKKSGCYVGYHHHQHEFRDKIDGVAPFQIVFDNASPLVCMQADVGHMVSAGEDPVAWFTKYGSRARTMHARTHTHRSRHHHDIPLVSELFDGHVFK